MSNPSPKHKKATSTSSDLQPAANPQNFSPLDNPTVYTEVLKSYLKLGFVALILKLG
ncbi:hypothetical protein H6G41_22835 [Tolypothrix sp. FACHB-123]|uniref:hypothetical protein n=1 Tax=Tolypothrix sp. FACHB-123 TaxID=2692868 RepID=UPI00168770E3|nr:hypothetical protein [Tolypothrix sp. FACHB-123]MBD2357419.1 hypothetical protein [Tolypothrix sp. FACHB-123]